MPLLRPRGRRWILTWLKLDDAMPAHRKLRRLSDAAFRLHVTALCDCAHHQTDGAVSRDEVETLTRAPTGERLRKAIEELEGAGLWETTEAGWMIHDFLDYNPSAASSQAKRAVRAEAGRTGGKRSGEARRFASETGSKAEAEPKQVASNSLPDCSSRAEAKTNPVPSRPVPLDDPDLEGVVPDLTGGPGVEAPEDPPPPERLDGIRDDNHVTPCPLDLAERWTGAPSMAEAMKVPRAAVDTVVEEFVTYWTIGGGAGKRRSQWARKLRDEVRRKAPLEAQKLTAAGAAGQTGPPARVSPEERARLNAICDAADAEARRILLERSVGGTA